MAYDEHIASICPARHVCKQHEILCGTSCTWFIDLRYQVALSGIPKRHTKWDVDTMPDDSENRAILQRYCDDGLFERIAQGRGLYLFGTVGNGKTTSACAIAMTYIVRQTREDLRTGARTRQLVCFVNVPDLLDEIRSGFSDDDKRAAIESKLQTLQVAPLVILDDLGAEKPSEWVRERLLTIVGARYDNELATIVTSNLTLAELKEPLGVRLASRIEGMTAPIQYRTSDRRRKI